jgi:hypothetical protein
LINQLYQIVEGIAIGRLHKILDEILCIFAADQIDEFWDIFAVMFVQIFHLTNCWGCGIMVFRAFPVVGAPTKNERIIHPL